MKTPTAPPQRTDAAAPERKRPESARVRASRDGLSQTVAAAAGLLAEGDRAHAGLASDARDLLLDEIEPDPTQPRRHFDEPELRSLADDIARRGVLQPILVRPPDSPGGRYRLVAGERRWRAARMAGKARIPARVREIGDEDVHAAQIAENVLRTGLTDIEKGRALRGLYELRKAQNHKVTWEDIASEVGLGRARIHDLFNLAGLPEPIAALIESGRLTGSHGIALQRAQDQLPESVLVELARQASRAEARRGGGYGLSVADLRGLIQARIGALSPETVTPGAMTPSAAIVASSPVMASPAANALPESRLVLPRQKSRAVRPFIQRTLDALHHDQLTARERALLQRALARLPEPPGDGTDE